MNEAVAGARAAYLNCWSLAGLSRVTNQVGEGEAGQAAVDRLNALVRRRDHYR